MYPGDGEDGCIHGTEISQFALARCYWCIGVGEWNGLCVTWLTGFTASPPTTYLLA